MSAARWCDGVEPVTVTVRCGSEDHRVTWRRGKLVLEDHRLAAERALLAFGGEPCACLQVLRLWRNLSAWAMPLPALRAMIRQSAPAAALAPPELLARRELGLAVQREREWRRAAFLPSEGRVLQEQINDAALPPVVAFARRSQRRLRAGSGLRTQVLLAKRGEPPCATGRSDVTGLNVTVRLGVPWLLGVWARGVACVEDAFVLDAVPGGDGLLQVSALQWRRQPDGSSSLVSAPAVITTAADSGWTLEWQPGEVPSPAAASGGAGA